MLPAHRFAKFYAGDFCDGIPLVGGLERAREEIFLFKRLWGELWINAGTAQEKQLFNSVFMGGMDQVILDEQVFVQKPHWLLAVGEDAAHFGSSHKNIIGLLPAVKFPHRNRVEQVQFSACFAN